MRLQWGVSYQGIGNMLGYATHQHELRGALEHHGVEFRDDARVVLHIATPETFQPVPRKVNILYTMYEGAELPLGWLASIRSADLVIVPCEFSRALFAAATSRPVELCHEGVDVSAYSFVRRSFPPAGEPFTYLWVGATNPRKGFGHVIAAWALINRKFPQARDHLRLIMKTTQPLAADHIVGYDPDGRPIREHQGRERVIQVGPNAYVDTRVLPKQTMASLYHRAHAFLLPSMGEGFGLTLAEAMATGLPCVYTPWSGPVDFVSSAEGYPVEFTMDVADVERYHPNGSREVIHRTHVANPSVASIAEQMAAIHNDYAAALGRGERAAERIRAGFTWDLSARRFIEIVRAHFGELVEAAA